MSSSQLPRSILLALGLAACDDKAADSAESTTGPCLDYPYDTDTGPCLEPHIETGDSGDTGDTGDSGDSGDTGDTGDVSPCLAPKEEESREDPGSSGAFQPVQRAIAAAVEATRKVLERGVLPEDVADLVRQRGPRR